MFEGRRLDVAEVDFFAGQEFADVSGFGAVEFGEGFDAEGAGGDVEELHVFGEALSVDGGVEVVDGVFEDDEVGGAHVGGVYRVWERTGNLKFEDLKLAYGVRKFGAVGRSL